MRYLLAAAICIAYALFTFWILRAHKRRAGENALEPVTSSSEAHHVDRSHVLIAFASQTGYAEQLAWQTARSLEAARVPMRVRSLAELSLQDLRATDRALFIVSTYGEGDPPDSGLSFANEVLSASAPLPGLSYGVLALGDRTYRNFCGFGRTLDNWLKRQDAVPLFDLVEVDNADENALRQWRNQLRTIAGVPACVEWTTPESEPWQLAVRQLLNPGSAGNPCFHIELTPPTGSRITWQAGDIAVITLPDGTTRDYSIASLPTDGSIHILVRQARRPDGTLGIASGWLTQQAGIGTTIPLRVRSNSNFHAPAPERPLILIGNGTGIAGLRSHLKAREQAGAKRAWLLFGERNARHDWFYREDIERWLRSGVLTRADLAFSRDQPERVYVQHLLQRAGHSVREWVADGAALYVCGSAQGMAAAVEQTLVAALGRDLVDQLIAERRLRRDVY